MPRGDGAGPMGLGSMTGRGAGYCIRARTPGYQNPPGWGLGGGGVWGGGRGRGGWFCRMPMPFYPGYASTETSREAELRLLEDEVSHLEGVLAELNARIKDLSPDNPTE